MTVNTRLPKPQRAEALALHDLWAAFEERRMRTYVELMPLNGRLLRWTKPKDDCFLIPNPGLVVNDIWQLQRVKRDIRYHLVEMAYERFKMEEIVKLVDPDLSLETYTQNQFAACRAVATRYSYRPYSYQGPGVIRNCSLPPRRTKQLL